MFADDTKVWTSIHKLDDQESLQRDLDRLGEWSKTWLLTFNPEKCKVMHIGHELPTVYTMKDVIIQLESTSVEKDLAHLGVLKPSEQCITVRKKSPGCVGNGKATV